MIANIVINLVAQKGIHHIIKAVNTPATHKVINEGLQSIISAITKK